MCDYWVYKDHCEKLTYLEKRALSSYCLTARRNKAFDIDNFNSVMKVMIGIVLAILGLLFIFYVWVNGFRNACVNFFKLLTF